MRDAKDYRLLPLCRAVATVLDRHTTPEQHPNIEPELDSDFEQGYLGIYAHSQTMLLIKTGDDADLSAPIDLTILAPHALPLGRPDFLSSLDQTSLTTIRVPVIVSIAVPFLYELRLREEVRFPKLYIHISVNKNKVVQLAFDLERWNEFLGREWLFYPQPENEWIREVFEHGKYRDAGEDKHYVQAARNRVKRRDSGEESWDDVVWTID